MSQMERAIEDFEGRTASFDGNEGHGQNGIVQTEGRVEPSQAGMPPRVIVAVIGDRGTCYVDSEGDRLFESVIHSHHHFPVENPLRVIRDHHSDPEGTHHSFSQDGIDQPVVATIGDSTFFHSGTAGLLNAVYNDARFVLVILDNMTTAMTGMQPTPALGTRADRCVTLPLR